MPNAHPRGKTRQRMVKYDDQTSVTYAQNVPTLGITRDQPLAPVQPRSLIRPKHWWGSCGLAEDPIDVALQWTMGRGAVGNPPLVFSGDGVLWSLRQRWQVIGTGDGVTQVLDTFSHKWDGDDEYVIDNLEPSNLQALFINTNLTGQEEIDTEMAGHLDYEVELLQREWSNPQAEWDGYEWEEHL